MSEPSREECFFGTWEIEHQKLTKHLGRIPTEEECEELYDWILSELTEEF